MQISAEAIRLRNTADKFGLFRALEDACMDGKISIPYYSRMDCIPIDEMNLSVRSSNALLRKGATTLGNVAELIGSGQLRCVRNLGAKSEKEIKQKFISTCYRSMTPDEQLHFWQTILNDQTK